MEVFFAIGSIAPFVGLAMVIVGIIVWITWKVVRLIPEELRGIAIWAMSVVVTYLVIVGIPFTLAVVVPEHRGLLVLVTLGANLWCFGLAYLVWQLLRREPSTSNL